MNKWVWIISGLVVIGGVSNCVDSCRESAERPQRIEAYCDETEQAMNDVEKRLKALPLDVPASEAAALLETLDGISTDRYDASDDDAPSDRIKALQSRRERLADEAKRVLATKHVLQPASGDTLLAATAFYPIHLERGETLHYSVESEAPVTVRVLNADSHSVAESKAAGTSVSGAVPVRFSAVYVVEVTPRGRQYATVSVGRQTSDMERIAHPKELKQTSENCERGDFMAQQIRGIKMTEAFEEPRKLTLRGQLKAAFSGSAVALVPIQVPKGATDILYNLRISTNETAPKGEKNFYEGMNLSYKKVKVLGLPIYESEGGSGLLTTLLGLNQPVREEDAYINMYVFYDAAQARKFQNGTPAKQLKYSLDYSAVGTQSCNGRIPTRGQSTVYLAFENERMRYNNYVWLSALLSVPQTEYVRPRYSVE